MTGNSRLFFQICPCEERWTVWIADGTQSQVAGVGTVKLTETFHLPSVLFVPDLDCNLLSASKISHDYNCITKFSKNLCEFQDLDMGRMIGSVRQYSGLYLLSSTHSLHGRNLHVELRVYSRRGRAQDQEEHRSLTEPEQLSNLDSMNQGNTILDNSLSEAPENDLDWPIALRKRVRSCTMHLLHN
ncbi:uncharacterized protein LOC127788851 isoform X1 [Diospyros lotus]|uniref:uncharacterized protein LOC127788851 isoform X1 n=1 Tax=Diospyros lotus TaxID=55363 RepID=UPI002256E790|nr:uncharacterized protein LOC127788851 isoform X1 [Diospyros lotus]